MNTDKIIIARMIVSSIVGLFIVGGSGYAYYKWNILGIIALLFALVGVVIIAYGLGGPELVKLVGL